MVYEDNDATKRKLAAAKVESQFSRALKYVATLNAKAVVPSAGPPCFLDESLFHLNVITGDEISIFPDQREFLKRLKQQNRTNDILAIPGTIIDISPEAIKATHPKHIDIENIFTNKKEYLHKYQADWATWLVAEKKRWATEPTDLIATMRVWFEPLMALAPALRKGIGANCLIKTDGLDIFLNFETGTVEKFETQEFGFRFTIPRDLLETVVGLRAVDWSNSLFLSCRFSAWRSGEFNEYLYNFFKSLSVERMQRTEVEAASRLKIDTDLSEEIQLGDYVMQRKCPHREADLSIFGEINGQELTCSLHGWRFDLNDGHCLNAENRPLRVRRRTS
jgi:UDP-MurNAc hydroxylase